MAKIQKNEECSDPSRWKEVGGLEGECGRAGSRIRGQKIPLSYSIFAGKNSI